MNPKKTLFAALVICLSGVSISSQVYESESDVAVKVEKVTPRQLQASVLASGKLTYDQQVALSSELIGKVTAVLVNEGDTVTKDQVLIKLDPRQYLAEMEQFEAVVRQKEYEVKGLVLNTENQQRHLIRFRKLHRQGLVGENDFVQVRHNHQMAEIALQKGQEELTQAKAQVKFASERLAKTQIKAPMSGTVTRVDIKPGETVVASNQAFAGTNLMNIARLDSMILEANVDESDIGALKLGQTAHIFAAAYPDQAIEGSIEQIAISPKNQTRIAASGFSANAYKVKITLNQPEDVFLRPGMSCRSEIFLHQKIASVTIPIQAVLENSDAKNDDATQYSVWVEAAGKAEKRPVVLGDADDQYQEVLGGLLPDERVIIGPASVLRTLIENTSVEILSGGFDLD